MYKISQEEVLNILKPNQTVSESDMITKRWENSRDRDTLVKDTLALILDSYKKSAIALILENQRLMNSMMTGDYDEELKKKLLHLTAYVYPYLLAWDLVSVQPQLGPNGKVYYIDHFCQKIEPIDPQENLANHLRSQPPRITTEPLKTIEMSAQTRATKKSFAMDFGPQDISLEIIKDMDNEVLKDLCNNSATVGIINLDAYDQAEKAKALHDRIKEMADYHKKNKGIEVNWLVVNPHVFRCFQTAFVGLDLKIYKHDGVEGILMGYKGESFIDSGYALSPYVPFTLSPTLMIDNDKIAIPCMFNGIVRYRFLTRYGKRLYTNGSNFYIRLNVDSKEVKNARDSA